MSLGLPLTELAQHLELKTADAPTHLNYEGISSLQNTTLLVSPLIFSGLGEVKRAEMEGKAHFNRLRIPQC